MDNFSFVMVVCPTKKGFPFTRQPVRTSHSSPPLSLSRSQHSVIEFCSPIEWAAQGKGMEGRGLSLNNTQVDRELSQNTRTLHPVSLTIHCYYRQHNVHFL